jgi:hypothetical protein
MPDRVIVVQHSGTDTLVKVCDSKGAFNAWFENGNIFKTVAAFLRNAAKLETSDWTRKQLTLSDARVYV